MTINELRLAIADAEDVLKELLRDSSAPRLDVDHVRRQLYYLQMELKYRLAGSSMRTYCEQNPWEPECKIYDV